MTATVPLTPCSLCRHPMPHGTRQCRKCHHWNAPQKPKGIEDSTVLLADAISQEMERIETGLVDTVFLRGIPRTYVTLLGGEPGAGKTTLCLQIADILADKFNKEALYIANEQSHTELKDTAVRLDLQQLGRIRIVKAMGGITHSVEDYVQRYQPCVLFLDSITNWVGEDIDLAVVIAKRIKELSVKYNFPSIVINQINKDGAHAGAEKLQHAVDVVAMFDILEDELNTDGSPLPKSESPRRLSTTKNRGAPAPEEQFYRMETNGLRECWPLDVRGWTTEKPGE